VVRLSKNFDSNEFTYSVTAQANKINNAPSIEILNNLKALCEGVLQPLRDYLGCAVKITSGYRCKALNTKVGGQPNSQHLYGQAADFIVPSKNLKDVFNYIKNNLVYDQLLFEHNSKGDVWIHISYVKNRMQAIDNYQAR